MEYGNSRILFILDLLIIFLFFFAIFRLNNAPSGILIKHNIIMIIIVILWFLICVNSDVLRINSLSNIIKIFKDTLIAYSVLSSLVISIVLFVNIFGSYDKLIIYSLFFSFLLSLTTRLVYFLIAKYLHIYGCYQKSVLIIGNGQVKDQLINKFMSSPELGIHISCILTDDDHNLCALSPSNVDQIDQYYSYMSNYHFDEVFIVGQFNDTNTLQYVIKLCELKGIRFYIFPDYFELIKQWTIINSIGNLPVIAVRNEPLNILGNRIIKRSFDILVSILCLIVFSPLFLIISIAIKLSSPGPILFFQERIGNNNVKFTLCKFRSMLDQPLHDSDTIWTTSSDSRITPIGRILRKTNLDELPQLWNVLVGDMSIVGPRPEREYFVEKFSQEIPNYRVRHLVKSGITGLAQANGWRGNTSIKKRIECDIYYLEHWSLWLDLKIILLTFFSKDAWKNAI
ncbi:undecaprenyl-phosphate glucose phosphotransferase [Desulfosarcina variabilis]|uniref:undecaprenyl-phosphate glucose phosphotransferase n=1 Tax=Desulfosarcina variabilis TaxID=2300 RepID=UPI003AFA3A90